MKRVYPITNGIGKWNWPIDRSTNYNEPIYIGYKDLGILLYLLHICIQWQTEQLCNKKSNLNSRIMTLNSPIWIFNSIVQCKQANTCKVIFLVTTSVYYFHVVLLFYSFLVLTVLYLVLDLFLNFRFTVKGF